MKIAFVVSRFPTVSETFILSQMVGLLRRGHDLHVFAEQSNYENDKVIHEDILKYGLLNRTHYFKKPPKQKWLCRIGFLLDFLRCFCKAPAQAIRVLKQSRIDTGAFSYSLFYHAMPFLVDRYDLIHCHFGTRGHIGLRAKRAGLCRKLVVTFYGFDISGYIKSKGGDVYRPLFQEADKLLVLSRSMESNLRDLGAPPEKIAIHHLGTSPGRFPYRERRPVRGRPVRLLTVARLTEKKGLPYSIEAVARLRNRNPDWRLLYHIVGEGEQRNRLETLIQDLGVSDCVTLCGAQSQAAICDFMDQADLFILASVTAANGDREGTPTTLIEAICAGLPVVSTHHAGIPEVVVDGCFGLLVPERDAEALVEQLEFLLTHQERWPQMSRAAREHFCREYNIHTLNRKLELIYREVLQADAGRKERDLNSSSQTV